MKKHFRFLFFLFVFVALNNSTVCAQNAFASEEELKAQASKLFEEDEFEEAYPLYSQLVSLYQKDPNYNYRLGVCMLYASDDKEKPISFLEFASKKTEVEKEVLFFLARAYHLNYRFDEAIKMYQDYKKVASSAKAEKLLVDRQIEMCRNGKKLLRNITDLLVIDKKEMSRADFYRSYDISDIGGKLLAKPDEPSFKTSVDKKRKEKSIIYLASNNNQVYFSSYGESGDRGKDIFIIRKLPNGEWSKPQTLGYPVNTEYDEDFPFLHPNGKVLYFCSKGHSSMGGYDIFKTTLNEETNTWNKPVNMDFPINTPDDDILYVTNEDEKEAFFSSARNSVTGKTAVFHVNVERKPIDVAIIKGKIVASKNGETTGARITVKDLGDNSILGIYNSKDDGGYLINLPNGGKFLFTVETNGYATQSEVIVLPTQYEFRPLKQEISYEAETSKLVVKNMFDETADDASYMLAMKLIKEKSKMEVSSALEIAEAKNNNTSKSSNTEETNSTSELTTTQNSSKNQPTNLTNNEIVKIAFDDAQDVEKEAKELKEQADIALALANQKSELAQNKLKEADQLRASANKMTDANKKQVTLEEANTVYKEADDLNAETVAAFNLAKRLEINAGAKQKEADLSLAYAKNVELAVKSKNATEALAKLDEQQKQLDALNAENNASANIVSSIKIDAENKKRELDKATQELSDVKQEIKDNEALIATTQNDIASTKNERIKEDLKNQIEGLKADNEQSKSDIVSYEEKVNRLQKEYDGILNEIAMVSNVVNQSKLTTNELAAASVATIDKNKLEQQVNSIKTAPALSTSEPNSATNSIAQTDNSTAFNNESNASVTSNDNNSTVTQINTPSEEAVEKIDFNIKYSEELSSVESISNPIERENKKVEIYTNWSNALTTEIASLKQEQKMVTDKEQKKVLSASIATLENELKSKQKLTKETIASAKKIEKEQAVAINASETQSNAVNNSEVPSTTTEFKSNQEYAEELFAAQNISNEVEREKAKAVVLTSWSNAINADMEKKKADMAATSDPEMKALLAQKLVDLKKQSEEKQTLANESLLKAEAAKSTTTVASNENIPSNNTQLETSNTSAQDVAQNDETITNKTASSNETVSKNNSQVEANSAKSNEAVSSNESISPNNTPLVTNNAETQNVVQSNSQIVADNETNQGVAQNNEAVVNKSTIEIESDTDSQDENETISQPNQQNQLVYNSSQASTEISKANVVKKEAENLINESNELKQKANETSDVSIRDDYYRQAEELENKARDKKVEAATLTATANKTEYLQNENVLQQLAMATPKNNSDELVMAEMMKDEAVVYYNKAKKNREEAAQAEQYYAKETLTEEAQKNEMIAIEKQQKATSIYKKYNPNFVASNIQVAPTNNTNTIVENTNQTTSNSEVIAQKSNVPDSIENTTANTNETTNTEIKNSVVATNDAVVNTSEAEKVVSDNNIIETVESPTSQVVSIGSTTIKLQPTEKFEQKPVPVYTATKPIPVNEKLPEGLVFKVQIGAFRNPIPQDLFKGMTPVTGETTPQGYIRYTAGLFKTFSTADKVKEEIRAMGYKDAFVVGFYNGKRISIIEALAIANGVAPKSATTTETIASSENTNSVSATTPNDNNIGKANSTPQNQVATSSQSTIVAPSENITKITGLFYTVQVGVYSQPVSTNKLNIQPLYTEKAPNGNIRYNNGIYDNIARAVEAKNIVIGAGISDAFVTAYVDGKRISLTEAQQLVSSQGSAVFSTAPNMNQLPIVGGSTAVTPVRTQQEVVSPKVTPVTETPREVTPSSVNSVPVETTQITNTETPKPIDMSKVPASVTTEKGIIFKVQIGAFKEEVPLEIANKFLRIAKMGVKNYEDERGLTVYTVGSYANYDDASKARQEVVAQGIIDAFIIAYNNGIKITIDEAKQLLNEK